MSGDSRAGEGAPRARSRSVTRSPKRPPPLAFFKGAGLGFVVVIPVVALTVWVLARLGLGNPDLTMAASIRMATIFAGLPAVLTAGGIGRLAAQASTQEGGRRAAVIRAVRVQAVAGAGLCLIAAIPHGHLPAAPIHWIWIGVAGAITGAGAGALIGLVAGAPPGDTMVPDLLRRVPVVSEWARAVARDPRLATAPTGDPRAAGRRALVTETARQTPPPTRPGRTRARRIEGQKIEPPVPVDTAAPTAARATSQEGPEGMTPLPAPVPLGDEVTTGVESPDEPAPERVDEP